MPYFSAPLSTPVACNKAQKQKRQKLQKDVEKKAKW